MPTANKHDQPVEGGRDIIEHTLQKQQAPDPKGQQQSKGKANPDDRSKVQSKTPPR